MTEPNPDLGVERRGAVLWLTIQREARRNAMSSAVLAWARRSNCANWTCGSE